MSEANPWLHNSKGLNAVNEFAINSQSTAYITGNFQLLNEHIPRISPTQVPESTGCDLAGIRQSHFVCSYCQ